MAAAAGAPGVPDLETLRAMFRAAVEPWPEYMTAISSITLIVGILANSWVVLRGLTSAPVRKSAFHLLLIAQAFSNLTLIFAVFCGMVSARRSGMGESESGKSRCSFGLVVHMWMISAGMCTHAIMALNRALACNHGWPLVAFMCSKKGTCVMLVLSWLACLLPYVIVATKHTTSFQGAFNCLIVDDYVQMVLSGKQPERPMKPALTITRDAMTSFIAIAILVIAFCYVIIAHGLGKLGSSQGDLGRTSIITALLFSNYISFWIPHLVGLYWDQELLKNDAYIYMPMLGVAVAPILYVITMAEYRPPFCNRGDGSIVSVTPLKDVE